MTTATGNNGLFIDGDEALRYSGANTIRLSDLPKEWQDEIVNWGGRVTIAGTLYVLGEDGNLHVGGSFPGSMQPGTLGMYGDPVAGQPIHDFSGGSGGQYREANESVRNLGNADSNLIGDTDGELDLPEPDGIEGQEPPPLDQSERGDEDRTPYENWLEQYREHLDTEPDFESDARKDIPEFSDEQIREMGTGIYEHSDGQQYFNAGSVDEPEIGRYVDYQIDSETGSFVGQAPYPEIFLPEGAEGTNLSGTRDENPNAPDIDGSLPGSHEFIEGGSTYLPLLWEDGESKDGHPHARGERKIRR